MVYDALVLTALLMAATWLFLMVAGDATAAPKRQYLQGYLWLTAGAYLVWCWKRSGQTLAMKTWHIALISRSGIPLSWQQAWLRYVLCSFSLGFFGAGYLWALFDRERLFLHDRLAGTRLVLLKRQA